MPVKITDLDTATTITSNDLIQIIDVDDRTMSPVGTNRKITASNAANQLANLISSVPPIMVTVLSTKANLNSPTFDGNVVLPTTTSIGPVNSAEIGRLSGVTSGIQGQLDLKANRANPTFTGTVTGITKVHVGLENVDNQSKATMFHNPTFTGNVFLPNLTTTIGSVSGTEISRLSGVTDNIQSQLNVKIGNITAESPIGITGTGASRNISLDVVPANKGGAGTTSGLLKANGSGIVSQASDTTDYVSPNTLKTFAPAAKAWINFNGSEAASIDKSAITTRSGTVFRGVGSTTAIITSTNHGLPDGYTIYASTGVAIGPYPIQVTGPDTFNISTIAATALSNVAISYAVHTVTKSGTVGQNTTATIRSVNHGLPADHKISITAISGLAAGIYTVRNPQQHTFDITVAANTTVITNMPITYTQHTVSRPTGSNIATIQSVNHGLRNGESIYASTGVVVGYYEITRLDNNRFTIITAANTAIAETAIAYKAYVSSSMIRSSYNISYINKSAIGQYKLYFSTPMIDSNYCVVASGVGTTIDDIWQGPSPHTFLQDSFTLYTGQDTDAKIDWPLICATVFGN
jgi:hypothetical protein